MERRIVEFGLRDYQQTADENVNRIFEGEGRNRFAGVILPTGGGKSFVAISQLMTFGKANKDNIEIDENGLINDAKMLYVAPSHEILNQVKLHFVKNVLLSINGIDRMSISELDEFLKMNLEGVDFPGINSNLGRGERPLSDSASVSEKKNAILRKLSVKDIDTLVSKAFPNLKFGCYAGVKAGEEVDNRDITEAELIITDEAHRLGATTWGKNFFENLSKNRGVKVLGITATPERTDSKAMDMFAEIAREIYPEQTVLPDEYMAQEIYVMDAMKDGIVIAPKVEQTDATLALSPQYKQLKERFMNMDESDPRREELDAALTQMEEIIGFSPRAMSDKQVEAEIRKATQELIQERISNKNGKYIAFIPANAAKLNDNKEDSAEYLANWKKRIQDYFKGVLDENGKPVKVTISFLTSNSSIMLDEKGNPVTPGKDDRKKYKRIDNSEVIKDFEDSSNESGGIKIIITNDILNEGVHVDGIDGSIMFRPAGTSTIYLQQSGRCISSLNPDKPLSEQPSTQIIDACGNSFVQISQGTGAKSSADYDLKRLKQIIEWIDNHQNKTPDINRRADGISQAEAENEARLAIAIKRIQQRYRRFYEEGITPIKDGEKVRELLSLSEQVGLFKREIGERELDLEPSEADLVGGQFLQYTESQRRFMDIYDRFKAKDVRMTAVERVHKLANITRILRMYKKDIKFPQGILIQNLSAGKDKGEAKEFGTPDATSLRLEDFLKANFDEATIQKILVDLKNYELMQTNSYSEIYHDGEEYDIGLEMAFVRGKLYTSQSEYLKAGEEYKLFDDFTIKDLITLGIIQDGREDIAKLIEMNGEYQKIKTGTKTTRKVSFYLDNQGRLKPGSRMDDIRFGLIDSFEECSLTSGEKYVDGYDREGYDKSGYDAEGYDRFGFDRSNKHRVTHSEYDERGFYLAPSGKWLNIHTQTEYDLLGYNREGFNEEGFERPNGPAINGFGHMSYVKPLWHDKLPNGRYSRHGYVYRQRLTAKEKTHDANGFETQTRHMTKDPRFSKTSGPGRFFLHDGSTRKVTLAARSYAHVKEDYYIDGLDIDLFDQNGFKKIDYNGKQIYIHRDTSSIHDRRGRMMKDGRLLEDPVITETKAFIEDVLGNNHSAGEFIRERASKLGMTVGAARKMYEEFMEEAFELSLKECPEAFFESKTFKGLEFYYLQHAGVKDKNDRLAEFFEYCPKAKEIIIENSRANLKALRKLQKAENTRGNLTPEEQQKREARMAKQKLYDQLDIDDRE